MLKIRALCTSHFALAEHSHRTSQLGIHFSWIPGSSASSTQTQPLSCWVIQWLSWLEHGRPFARSRVRVPPWVTVFFPPLYFFVCISHLSLWLWLGLWSDCLEHVKHLIFIRLVLHAHRTPPSRKKITPMKQCLYYMNAIVILFNIVCLCVLPL